MSASGQQQPVARLTRDRRLAAKSGRPHIVKSCPNTELPNHWLGDSLASNIGWKIFKS